MCVYVDLRKINAVKRVNREKINVIEKYLGKDKKKFFVFNFCLKYLYV